MFAPKRILVPTDFSDYSDEALKQALELAKQYNAKVYLLHVAEPITQCVGDYCLDESKVKAAEDTEILQAKEKMQKELKKISRIPRNRSYYRYQGRRTCSGDTQRAG